MILLIVSCISKENVTHDGFHPHKTLKKNSPISYQFFTSSNMPESELRMLSKDLFHSSYQCEINKITFYALLM